MNKRTLCGAMCLLAALAIPCSNVSAAAKKAEPGIPLTEAGEKLLAKYSATVTSLQAEVGKALPKIDESKKAAFVKAYEAEMAAAAAEDKALKAASWKNPQDKEAAGKALKAAQEALAKAEADAQAPVKAMLAAVENFLASGKADAQLMRCAILTNATPRGLADFAQQGNEQAALVEELLADTALMKQMLEAGGAQNGKYGQAMQIYSAIQKASPKAKDGLFQRLALATSLEHAVPIPQSNPKAQADAPATVDPVKRYLHYEKAYLDGELDPAFKNFSVWEYRMIVQCDAPDHILAWGREMLRNYRPDYVYTPDSGWRYSKIVKSDVLYGSQDVKNDLPELQNYQNIIKNGGVCGRRAFFARFLLCSFGNPTWGVTQHAHAAAGRWTQKGWVVNLGAAFKWSWWDKDGAPRSGTDFLLETQARAVPQNYLKVLRSQWISDVLGERAYNDRKGVAGGFWSALAHYQALAIAAATKAVALAPVGQDVAEASESKEKDKVEQAQLSEADQKTVVGQDGVITIPAVVCSKSAGTIAMKSFAGGMQLHCVRDLKSEQEFECTFDAPQAGKYALAARVVTVQSDQKLMLAANDAKEPVEIAVPYTLGRWEHTKPVEIALVKGQNVLRFTRPAPSRGLTIKDFTLTPVR